MQLIFAAVLSLCIAGTLQAAYQVDFANLTHSNVEDLSGQLRLTIYGEGDNGLLPFSGLPSLGANQALFVLENAVGVKSSVTQIYVDADVLDGIAAVYNTNSAQPKGALRDASGILLQGLTTFSTDNKLAPGNLPGSESFVADPYLSLAMTKGNPTGGLNEPTERLAVLYDVDPMGFDGMTGLDAVVAAMIRGQLKVGLHVQAVGAKGKSDSYLSGATPVPEPAALAVWGFGCACVFCYRRWRRLS